MRSPLLGYFALQRAIFGICPNCGDFFRLSESRVFIRAKPSPDWMDALELKNRRLDAAEERLSAREDELRRRARERGRREAMKQIRMLDPVFTPRHLNPDDAKVVFHPIDFLVFDGMKTEPHIRRVLLLDRESKDPGHRVIQRSIEKAVQRGRFDWKTLLVRPDGSIVEK